MSPKGALWAILLSTLIWLGIIATAKAASPMPRVTAIANHLPRDGQLYRGRLAGCSWQARIFRDGHGYAGVICGGAVLVSFRDTRGHWGRTA